MHNRKKKSAMKEKSHNPSGRFTAPSHSTPTGEKTMAVTNHASDQASVASNGSEATSDVKGTTANAEAKSKKVSLSFAQKIKIMRKHLVSQMSKENICDDMGLTSTQFTELYFHLTQQDGKAYPIPHKSRVRRCRIGAKGFTISMDKIITIGMDDTFREGLDIEITRDGHKLILEAIDPDNVDISEECFNDDDGELTEEADAERELVELFAQAAPDDLKAGRD